MNSNLYLRIPVLVRGKAEVSMLCEAVKSKANIKQFLWKERKSTPDPVLS